MDKGTDQLCNCVLRSCFRAVFRRYRTIRESGPFRPNAARFLADFENVSKKALSASEHKLFRYRYIVGADERSCCRELRLDPGVFNHAVYRIQQKLGRVFCELSPFSLFPVGDYFGLTHSVKPSVPPEPLRKGFGPVRPPLAAPKQPVAHPAPVPVPVVPVLVPRQPVDPQVFARERFKAGLSTRAIAASLNVVAPNATRWYQSDVKRLLLLAA
jgi:hypothetical protein